MRLDEAARHPDDLEAAVARIGAALERGTSPREAAEAIAPAHWPLLAAMAEQPAGEAVVRRLLRTAYRSAADAPDAPEPAVADLRALAREAVFDPSPATRFDAAMTLRSGHAERAVPELLRSFKADAETSTRTWITLFRLGEEAVLPLVASARTEDPELRRCLTSALVAIGDPRALPVVLELRDAARPRQRERADAARAATRLSSRAAGWIDAACAADAYRDLARRYYEGDPRAARLPSGPPVVWSLEDDGLVATTVDRHLYFIELGKRAAEDALRLDPRNEQAPAWLERLSESEALAEKLVRDLGR